MPMSLVEGPRGPEEVWTDGGRARASGIRAHRVHPVVIVNLPP